MPELPEVEVLVRHLQPLLTGRRVGFVEVRRTKSVRPQTAAEFARALRNRRFTGLRRRGKFLLFDLAKVRGKPETLVGHLGMTGRMFLQPVRDVLPKHAAVVFGVGQGERFVFEDPRYFGRLSFDASPLARLGAEPLDHPDPPESFVAGLRTSRQPVKVRLLDQSVVAGVGNIYASEALFVAGIWPVVPAARLGPQRIAGLWRAIREVLSEAIAWGSTVPLNWSGAGGGDALFYYGGDPEAPDTYEERLRVYDRAGEPCGRCGDTIQRTVLGSRSTFHCPRCQRQ
ncbi:MAG: bifunctional DNA-formamidopyrimidine glycosylase/DNA-(apurinic or apyrimidinic site) lyase [Verrucomicrobiae bacterium]|nr:bifunctional DNA-formamidopyrimidine glycosylase/DNA-(apurinic or apyrimidinic site) lyase [Verrucomicrobiae bacterium]